ncbi:XRE family transcriptional regulator [Eubacteriaceae bacterium ES2]|nr:XRE family transcriptional regulator [Eubacteriaceae bacterium ES2]
MEINEIIKKRRLELGLTLKDVAQALGVAESTVLRYERNDIKHMGIDKIEQLAGVLKCSPTYLLGWKRCRETLLDEEDIEEICPEVAFEETVRMKILGSLPAGVPPEEVEDVIGYDSIFADWLKGDFQSIALMIRDDATAPKYLEDDIVIIFLTNHFYNDQDALVHINQADATIRKIHKNDDGSITLIPYNHAYLTQTFAAEDKNFVIVGYVRAMKRVMPTMDFES